MSMKVGSTSSAKSVGSARKTGGVSSSGTTGFSALLGEVEETSAPSVAATANVGGVEALLAAQAVGDALQDDGRKRRAVARGNDILDKLEDLRAELLTNGVSKQKLIALAQELRERRDAGLDDELNAILDEIELRAEVELAKLNV